jgi:hypothetical protein
VVIVSAGQETVSNHVVRALLPGRDGRPFLKYVAFSVPPASPPVAIASAIVCIAERRPPEVAIRYNDTHYPPGDSL